MLKQTLIASMMTLILLPSAYAKVTYEDAVKDQSAYNAKLKALAPPPAVGYTIDELSDFENPGGDWTQIYTGSTTGRVNIPSNAKMIMVQTSEGTVTFPRNSGSLVLASKISTTSEKCHLTATARARFTGSQVMGEYSQQKEKCRVNGDYYFESRSAQISIQKVLIQN